MKVTVVGGGASGMVAAIVAARDGHEVTILEHKDKIGRKLLATGNGRCNITNTLVGEDPAGAYGVSKVEGLGFSEDVYAEFVKSVFDRFSYSDTISFFSDLGLIFKYRGELVYPNSDQASSVLDALRFELRDLGVDIRCNFDVRRIAPLDGGFEITGKDRSTDDEKTVILKADKVILAAGSQAQPKLGADGTGYVLAQSLGHKIARVTPGLVQFRCEGKIFKELAGVRTPARISLCDEKKGVICEESGELQLTDYGVSGIAAMNLSNKMGQIEGQPYLKIDLMERMSASEVRELLDRRKAIFGNREAVELLNGIFPKKLSDVLLKISKIPFNMRISDIDNSNMKQLLSNIKGWVIKIIGTNSFNEAQICLGGICLEEVKDTMESTIVRGLYFAGEILDMHGDCGGFNLQLAWSTGAIAGRLE